MDIFRKIKTPESAGKELEKSIFEIDKLTKEWHNRAPRVLTPDEKESCIEEVIAASLSLENISFSKNQIHNEISQKESTGELKEGLIAGYNTILNALFSNPNDYPLCEDTIIALHSTLFPHEKKASGNKTQKPGAVNFLDYKKPTLFNQNKTLSVNNEIHDLVEWTNRELTQNNRHKLIIIAAFAYEFISIHPFREGKGILSRILSTLLLLQNGYEWAGQTPIDSFIEKNRTHYHGTLKKGQQNRYSVDEDITEWVQCLCRIWLQALHSLLPSKEIQPPVQPSPPAKTVSSKANRQPDIPRKNLVYLNARQKKILAYMREEEPVKVSDIACALGSVSINTIKKDLLYLRQQNLIESHGLLKGTSYTLKNKPDSL